MLKNKEIRQKYPFFTRGLNYFEAEWITCGCICTLRKEEWKDYCNLEDIAYHALISLGVTRWLSLCPSLTRKLQMQAPQVRIHTSCPSTSQVLFWNVFWKFSSELCLRHLHSFVVAFNEQVQNIGKSKASIVEVIVCRHCEGKDSRETIRYTCQAN